MSFCRSRGRPRLGGPGNRDLEDRKSVKPSSHRGHTRRIGGDHHRLRGIVHDGLELLDFFSGIFRRAKERGTAWAETLRPISMAVVS
jgi:hypothetical protein